MADSKYDLIPSQEVVNPQVFPQIGNGIIFYKQFHLFLCLLAPEYDERMKIKMATKRRLELSPSKISDGKFLSLLFHIIFKF